MKDYVKGAKVLLDYNKLKFTSTKHSLYILYIKMVYTVIVHY